MLIAATLIAAAALALLIYWGYIHPVLKQHGVFDKET